jgi:hypothetical protein
MFRSPVTGPVPCSFPTAFEIVLHTNHDYLHLLGTAPGAERLATPSPARFDRQEPVIRGSWGAVEDGLLSAAVARYGCNQWGAVAAQIPGRNATQCRERWMFRIGPDLNKDPFGKWEDDLIIDTRKALGNRWALIASKLPGRTSCSVKNRWYSVLRKRKELELSPARLEESPYSISALLVKSNDL